VKSMLSANRVLTITAAKREIKAPVERPIAVEYVGSGDAAQ